LRALLLLTLKAQ